MTILKKNSACNNKIPSFFTILVNFWPFLPKITFFVLKLTTIRRFTGKICCIGKVFSTEKLFLIRVPQYWANGVKGGCKGDEYSKTPKNP